MKLELAKEWFEKNIPHDNPEVGAGLPERGVEQSVTEEVGMHRENGFAEAYAAGSLVSRPGGGNSTFVAANFSSEATSGG
jgi:hypothetical protein